MFTVVAAPTLWPLFREKKNVAFAALLPPPEPPPTEPAAAGGLGDRNDCVQLRLCRCGCCCGGGGIMLRSTQRSGGSRPTRR